MKVRENTDSMHATKTQTNIQQTPPPTTQQKKKGPTKMQSTVDYSTLEESAHISRTAKAQAMMTS